MRGRDSFRLDNRPMTHRSVEAPVAGIGAILLAAGRGERLRPLTDSVPKVALEVGGKPLGAFGLAALKDVGGGIVVNLSWLHETARAALEPYAPAGTEWFVESPKPLGTAGTVAALLPRLAATFVTMNADTITDLRIADLVAGHRRTGTSGTLAVQMVATGADFEVEDERATRLIDRRAAPSAAGARYIGVAAFQRDGIAPFLSGLTPPAGLAEALFGRLAAAGELGIHRHAGFAIDAGTPGALARARERRFP